MLANLRQPGTSLQTRSPLVGTSRSPNKRRTSTQEGEKEAIWVPMLQSASKGKDLSEKQLILLGGSPSQQREFLDHLNPESLRTRNNDRRRGGANSGVKNIPVSNKYALGYTYQDVLDADQEEVLARLHVYMLTNPSGAFAPLLKPLLTTKTVQETLVVILLDWSDPFIWARQLRQWIRLLRKVILALDEDTKVELEECMNAWREKRVGPDAATALSNSTTTNAPASASEPTITAIGPGEWEDGLGIPLAVACVQAEAIARLEKDLGWQDEQFDFLQQWLRTVLLKHGASLIYTASFEPNNVRSLIHSTLSISSLLKKEIVKHNVIDRDKILVPPNWDSWGKIRILREGFDPEVIGDAWSVEIQGEPAEQPDFTPKYPVADDPQAVLQASQETTSAVSIFEKSLQNPTQPTFTNSTSQKDMSAQIVIMATPLQEFLQSQTTVLEKLLEEDRQEKVKAQQRAGYLDTASLGAIGGEREGDSPTIRSGAMSPVKGPPGSRLTDNVVGPYQINVNGIDFDAEEATRRLRERENERNAARNAKEAGSVALGTSTPNRSKSAAGTNVTAGDMASGQDASKPSNEALHGFFANLIKKGQQGGGSRGSVGSGAPSPRRESPAPDRKKSTNNQ